MPSLPTNEKHRTKARAKKNENPYFRSKCALRRHARPGVSQLCGKHDTRQGTHPCFRFAVSTARHWPVGGRPVLVSRAVFEVLGRRFPAGLPDSTCFRFAVSMAQRKRFFWAIKAYFRTRT